MDRPDFLIETEGQFLVSFNVQAEMLKNIEAEEVEAEKKQITIAFELPDTAIPAINADAAMINRMIRNPLDNAIKYTNSGDAVTINVISFTLPKR